MLDNENNIKIGRDMCRLHKGLYVSKWANAYSCHTFGRDMCLKTYRKYIRSQPNSLQSISTLNGKTLGCFCWPLEYHGNIIISVIYE